MTRQLELNNLNECIIFEVCIQYKKGYIILIYRSLSQAYDKFDNFLLNSEPVLCDIVAISPLFVLITNDFNATSENW